MSELNLDQIKNRLNELFITYGERKLIFWFDPLREFEEDIDNGGIILESARIRKIAPHTQFLTKRFFELEDTENSYLIYAPFKNMADDDEDNHLLSLIKYSTLFSADRIALLMTQLNIPTDLYVTMDSHSKFFAAKSRISAFEKLMPAGVKTKEELELAMMAVLTKANNPQFYSILQALLIAYAKGKEEYYNQLDNYRLKDSFWEHVAKYYGYATDDEPTVQKLVIALFANAFYGQLGHQELPTSLKQYEVREQTTAIISFIDGFMNDSRYREDFEELSKDIFILIDGERLLAKAPIEELVSADLFEPIHDRIVHYYIDQLMSGDTTPTINSLSLQSVVERKIRAHFGSKYAPQYRALVAAQELLNYLVQSNFNQFDEVVEDYEQSSFMLDRYYRKYIWNLDQVENKDSFNELSVLVEKQYKVFLNEISRRWNDELHLDARPSMLDFYDNYGKNKAKTVVIISDALRYEVAKEIQTVLQKEKKYNTKMATIFSVLPSVTEFGKAASLRSANQKLSYLTEDDVRLDDMRTNGTENRGKILKAKNENSIAITYDAVMAKDNAKELRDLFNGQEVIYLYHDQIDKTGDHGQEFQIFDAVQRTIDELRLLLPRISNGANIYRFIITSDHGFIYTRSKPAEHEKIENPSTDKEDRVERRFIISKNKYDEIGVTSMRLGEVLRNEDQRHIHFPETSAVFKRAGGGQSYVHGGSSPQEMIVPVLEVVVARGSATKERVQIQLTTPRRRVVGLSTSLEFYQTEAISDSITKGQYALYFEDQNGNRISNENMYFADSTSLQAADRFSNFTFNFVNRNYSIDEKVFLVIKNSDTQIENDRVEFVIDNPFAGDFGFDF